MNDKFRTWHNVCLFSYFGLLATLALWYFILSPPKIPLAIIAVVLYVIVLLIPSLALIKKHPKVYGWSGYLMLVYFFHAVGETWANADYRLLAIAELLFSTCYFFAATYAARYVKTKSGD